MLPEIALYLERLRERRTEILRCVQEVSADALDWKPAAPDTNSIAVLATHSLGAERRWLHSRVGKMDIEVDRDAEFRAQTVDLTSLAGMYATVADTTEQILTPLTLEEMNSPRTYREYSWTVRWCILHVLEHYSEHLGQMWLTRQLFESSRH